jgi:hypothetical protein
VRESRLVVIGCGENGEQFIEWRDIAPHDYEGGRRESEQPPAVYRLESETGDIRTCHLRKGDNSS